MLTTYTIDNHPYQVYRAGMDGPVLLFVHGFPINHAQWENQFLHFAASYRVIAPDLRGLGGSKITGNDSIITMERHADDLNMLLDELHITEPVVFIGLSMGGYVAWQMVKKYPQRLRSLVFCDTRVAADTPEQAQARLQLADETIKTGTSLKIEEVMLPRLLPASADHSIVDAIRQMARSASPAGLAATLRGMAARIDAAPLLPSIKIPTLAISGEHDVISPPAEMSAWATKISNSRFVSLPGVGHMTPMEAPHEFNQLLTESLPWLTGTTSR
ncbi:MAG TPA: alpha/beta hydrolase [Gemmatales bacterium]|nr:alpha/beta hydrolase [Gemmatales bacterium]